MRKWITICLFLVLLLVGCGGTNVNDDTNTEEQNIEFTTTIIEREVFFLSKEIPFVKNDINLHMLFSQYDEITSSEALYAFRFDNLSIGRDDPSVILTENGVCKIKEYPIQGVDETVEEYQKRCDDYRYDAIRAAFLKEGMYILEDDKNVVVGTMDDFRCIFREMDSLDGWGVEAVSAVYPEIESMEVTVKQFSVKVSLIALAE